MRVWVRKRRFWWTATNPDEAIATIDTQTYFRARTRERAIEKCLKRFAPQDPAWEEVVAPVGWRKPRTEGREGIVTVYDHKGGYLGCMGRETWENALAEEVCPECGCPGDEYDGHVCEDHATAFVARRYSHRQTDK